MSWRNKVVWSQGMFLQPHHFQQEARYIERALDSRIRALSPFAWGFAELQLDDSLLALGRVGIARASGIWPDGTPFAIPQLDPAPAPLDGALGANFNEHYEDVDFAQLRRANDQWIRGFLTMPQVDPANPGAHPAVATTLDAERHGFQTILTFKWPMQKTGIPKAGSPAFARAMRELDAVLPLVMGKADILEIGNEPFIESMKSEQDKRLNDFYEAMAKRVIAYRAAHCPGACRTRLFMGALNQMWNPAWRTATTDRWLQFVRETPEMRSVTVTLAPSAPSAVRIWPSESSGTE